jgi:hypothetical protein
MRHYFALIDEELIKYRGTRGIITENGLQFLVDVMDVRRRYGHTDVLVRPVAGEGETWVDTERFLITSV